MDMKKPNFLQIDNKIVEILKADGVEILPVVKAWTKYPWMRNYVAKKPKEGYFLWVKRQPKLPLSTCVTIASKGVVQTLSNFVVIEKNIKAYANVICNSSEDNLCGKHFAKGTLILKENSSLEYMHIHKWGHKDYINPDYEFFLEKNSQLKYTYENLYPPKELNIKTVFNVEKNTSANANFVINAKNSFVNIDETMLLKGENSKGVLRLKLVGKERSKINSVSKMEARKNGTGHLECEGLVVDKASSIELTPKLVCLDNKSQLTHEASIGRISSEQLNYLKSRGLSLKESIDLIVSGFLKV